MARPDNNLLYDGFLELDAGIHSGIAPLLLQKNQPAFAVNTTFRGGFPTARSARRKLTLAADIDALLQDAFSQGLFQGATKFLPYGGTEALAASIAGRLFQITPDNSGGATGLEFTIPGDRNPAFISQSWLWQAERWLIVQNGINRAIAYDGVSARRLQPTVTLQGTTNADFIIPPIGGTVAVTLVAGYTGLLNSIMRLDKIDSGNVTGSAYYMVTAVNGNATQYQVVLTNLGDTAGQVEAGGSQLIIQPANLGNIVTVSEYGSFLGGFSVEGGGLPVLLPGQTLKTTTKVTVAMSSPVPAYVAVKAMVTAGGSLWTIVNISADRTTLKLYHTQNGTGVAPSPAPGQNVILQNYNAPNTVVGTLAAAFTAPQVGQNVTTSLTTQFFQNPGTILFVNNEQYRVVSSAVTPPTPSASITLQNINDSDLGKTVKTGSKLYNLPELPPGRMGTYGLGRTWQCLVDGFSFIASDLAGGASGSPIYQSKDAVLKVTENSQLAGGGSFAVPGNTGDIRAMLFTATLDVSLGQGPLQVFTSQNIFSCQAPTDRTTWQNLSNPILTESLIGAGCSGANAAINSNADIIFRVPNNDVRSLNLARRDFYRWGDTPIDYEITRIIEAEDATLMPWCSVIDFDNRVLFTANPVQGSHGVYWPGLIALNFDEVGSVEGKTGLFYEGLWTDLNSLQLVKFATVNRAFAFVHNLTTDKLELWEILTSAGSTGLDSGTDRITLQFETPLMFYQIKGKSVFDLVRLEDGEVYLSGIPPGQKVDCTVEYRPDFSDCWFPWHTFSLCSDPKSTADLYGSRQGLGQPPAAICNPATGTPGNFGRWFQMRVTVTGPCVFNGARFSASLQPEPKFAIPTCP